MFPLNLLTLLEYLSATAIFFQDPQWQAAQAVLILDIFFTVKQCCLQSTTLAHLWKDKTAV